MRKVNPVFQDIIQVFLPIFLHTVGPVLSDTRLVRHPAFFSMTAVKSMYILVYFTAVPPYAVCSSNF